MSGAWVVFSGQSDVWFLRFLKPGFRHCFVLLCAPYGWVLVDAMLHKMDVAVMHDNPDFDLPGWMRSQGFVVVRAPQLIPERRVLMPAILSCVEVVKRVIGLQAWWVLTPYQLYKRLVFLSKKTRR